MADLTVGIAGTGRMAARMMQAFAVVPGLRAVAVASGDPARARAFAEAHGLTPAGSVAEMAATVDLVYVAGRVRDHLPAARAAIAAGRPVLVEKPLAATAAEAREMVEAARAADVLLIENLWSLALPAWAEMGRLAGTGDLGMPLHLEFGFGYPADPQVYGSIYDPADGGALRDRGIYGIALALTMLGPVEDVTCGMRRDERGADLGAALMLGHAGGGMSQITVALDTGLSNTAVLGLERGVLRLGPPVVGAERLGVEPMALGGAPADSAGLKDRLRALPLARRANQTRAAAGARFLSYGRDQYAPMMEHVADVIRTGRSESDLVPLSLSLAAQDVLTKAREG